MHAMTEYFREPENLIRAGFALNAGKLVTQYLRMTTTLGPAQRYEATLTLCVLQALLTQCSELIKEMSEDQNTEWMQDVTDVPTRWGLRRGFVKVDTFLEPLTYKRFLNSLRNACSHPTGSSSVTFPQSTGYSTIPGRSGQIETFEFCDSPNVIGGRIDDRFLSNARQKVDRKCAELTNAWRKLHSNSCPPFEVVKQGNKFQIYKDNQPFLQVFKAEIGLPDLIKIVSFVANYLAQPTQDFWDGSTVSQLIA